MTSYSNQTVNSLQNFFVISIYSFQFLVYTYVVQNFIFIFDKNILVLHVLSFFS